MDDRNIAFEKISNARDMGGLRTAQGYIISSGLLIRSANLSDATEADRSILRKKYRLSKIIDLRTEIERNERPDASMEAVEYLPIPIFEKSAAGISHEKRSGSEQLFAVMPKMGQLYCKMVTDPSCRENRNGSGKGEGHVSCFSFNAVLKTCKNPGILSVPT